MITEKYKLEITANNENELKEIDKVISSIFSQQLEKEIVNKSSIDMIKNNSSNENPFDSDYYSTEEIDKSSLTQLYIESLTIKEMYPRFKGVSTLLYDIENVDSHILNSIKVLLNFHMNIIPQSETTLCNKLNDFKNQLNKIHGAVRLRRYIKDKKK